MFFFLFFFSPLIGSVLQMEMEHLNQTKGEIHASKQRHMLEELEVLLETMSDVNLTVGNALAGQELM